MNIQISSIAVLRNVSKLFFVFFSSTFISCVFERWHLFTLKHFCISFSPKIVIFLLFHEDTQKHYLNSHVVSSKF